MEGGGSQKDYSKASSDELDSSDQPTDDVGTAGKFYECIFCKRGFSTAQALGGHMNIHRKDRAKMRQNPLPSKPDEEPEGYGYHNPYVNHHNHRSLYPPVSESLKNYSMLFSASATGDRDMREDGMGSRRPQELSLFGEELHLGLRVHGDGRRVVVGEEERRVGEEEGEVDLELRLGHEP